MREFWHGQPHPDTAKNRETLLFLLNDLEICDLLRFTHDRADGNAHCPRGCDNSIASDRLIGGLRSEPGCPDAHGMDAGHSHGKMRVYRVRCLPVYADRHDTADLLSKGLEGVSSSQIIVYSVATSVSPWEEQASRTATVSFRKAPKNLHDDHGASEWRIAVEGLRHRLILDTHFKGMTALNDPTSQHKVE